MQLGRNIHGVGSCPDFWEGRKASIHIHPRLDLASTTSGKGPLTGRIAHKQSSVVRRGGCYTKPRPGAVKEHFISRLVLIVGSGLLCCKGFSALPAFRLLVGVFVRRRMAQTVREEDRGSRFS